MTLPEQSKSRRWTAALTLVFLAPFIGEVLSGATRLSFIFAFIPEMMVWGCGALIIRETVRRWSAGWTSMLLLGLGLSIAEEFLIQQTSLAPLPWPTIAPDYGRLFGVNWIYFLFMLGYECVWIVLVPVQVTELIFSRYRNEPWLKTRGLIISSLIFLLGSFLAWYAWIKRARPIVFHAPTYNPPIATILAGAAAIVLLAFAAYAARHIGRTALTSQRTAPPAWAMVIATIVFSFPWNLLLAPIFGSKTSRPFGLLMLMGIVWAALAYFLIRYWSSAPSWQDTHRWAVVFGATISNMAAGFSGSSTWPKIDLIGKVIFNILAIVGFALLLRRIRRRELN